MWSERAAALQRHCYRVAGTIASRRVSNALTPPTIQGGTSRSLTPWTAGDFPVREGKPPPAAAIPFMSLMFMNANAARFRCTRARRSQRSRRIRSRASSYRAAVIQPSCRPRL
jgi:hypothetical protein